MQRSIVDLPEPEAPRIEITSPSAALSDTPFSTSSGPKRLRRSRIATAAGAGEGAVIRAPLRARGRTSGGWRRCGDSHHSRPWIARVTRKLRMR